MTTLATNTKTWEFPDITSVDFLTGAVWYGLKYYENKRVDPLTTIGEGFLLSVGSKVVNQGLSMNETFATFDPTLKVAGCDMILTTAEQYFLRGKNGENSLINGAKYTVLAGLSEFVLTGKYAYSDYVNYDIFSKWKLSAQNPGKTNVSEKA